MKPNKLNQAKARKAYQKRRLRANIKALNNIPNVPDERPTLAEWQPLVRVEPDKVNDVNALMNVWLLFPVCQTTYFANGKFFIALSEGTQGSLHILIKPLDCKSEPSWAECQAIKNQLLGTDQEMMQLYPSEMRMVNAAHLYHLWGSKGVPVPVGLDLFKLISP